MNSAGFATWVSQVMISVGLVDLKSSHKLITLHELYSTSDFEKGVARMPIREVMALSS